MPRPSIRLITHAGETLNHAEWERRLGLSSGALYHRLRLGWTEAEAVTTPRMGRMGKRPRMITCNGETLTIAEWADRLRLGTDAVDHRLRHGWPVDDALTRPSRRQRS